MMWFTSDTHFYHRKVIEYCDRPFSTVETMNEALIENWNKVVKKNDVIFVLGDFAFAGVNQTKKILDRLNGQKILVRGNHDPHAKLMLDAGFSKVVENEMINLGGENVLLSHFPYHPIKAQVKL